MKRLLPIFLMIIAAISYGIALDVYEISDGQTYSIELSGEGSTEKDASKNTEDDTEVDSFVRTDGPKVVQPIHDFASYSHGSMIAYFMEIPNPPPDFI